MNWKAKVDGFRVWWCMLSAVYAGAFFGAAIAGLMDFGFLAGLGWLMVILNEVFEVSREEQWATMNKLSHEILDLNGELIARLQTDRPFVVTRQGRELN